MKNGSTTHPLQSVEWGEFRKKTGIKVVRINGIQMTIHKIPYVPWTVGYIPKGPIPTITMISDLKKVGKQENCIFIQLEPNVERSQLPNYPITQLPNLHPSFHPLFTKYTFILDLTKSDEELLRQMHPKTRYNIRIALKHDVKIVQDESMKAFKEYLRLTEETTRRQGFYAHTQEYHKLMWETLRNQEPKVENQNLDTDKLTTHLFLAKYKDQALAAWIVFVYKNTLYYPYGASSGLHREAMASNLMMWEIIKFGKKMGLKKFDMWGALSNNPDKNDSWYGFHRFKEGYGPKHIEFIGSFDLVINPLLYKIYKASDKIRWILLGLNPFGKLRINAEQSRSIKR